MVLKPINDTVTVYVPPGSAGMVKVPFVPVTEANLTPVALFCATTSAPGTTAPEVSTTVPERDAAVLPPWAYARDVSVRTTAKGRSADCNLGVTGVIGSLPFVR